MKIEIDRQKKIVEMWLTNQEQQNAAVMESLADYYRQYQAEKYRVAVFFSGKRELTGLTEELLLHNRRAAIRKESEQGMSMKIGI